MGYIQAVLMGFIQGLTEFLPVSSSGHLVLVSSLYQTITGVEVSAVTGEEVFFDIMLHLATLVAVLVYFRQDIYKILKDFFVAIKTRDFSSPEAKLPIFIIIGTFFTVIIAFPLTSFCEKLIVSPAIVGCFLVVTAVILYSSEFISKRIPIKGAEVNLKTAILIGIAQGLAAFPGISRSGSTIATGLFMGLDRVTCARYSFLLSIPVILGASMLYPILQLDYNHVVEYNWGAIAVGFLVSVLSGYFCIKYFLKFLQKHSMNVFAYYCLGAGIFMIAFFGFFVK